MINCFLDVLAEAIYLSLDPYMRPYSERLPLGVTMIGGQVARYEDIKYISNMICMFIHDFSVVFTSFKTG